MKCRAGPIITCKVYNRTYVGEFHEASCVFNSEEFQAVDTRHGPDNLFVYEAAIDKCLLRAVRPVYQFLLEQLTVQSQVEYIEHIIKRTREQKIPCLVEAYLCNLIVMTLCKLADWLSNGADIPKYDVFIGSSANKICVRRH